MNPERSYSSPYAYLSRADRRKKGQRSGYKVKAQLPKKKK